MNLVRDDQIVVTPINGRIARAPGKLAADEVKRKRRIGGIDISGTDTVRRIKFYDPATLL